MTLVALFAGMVVLVVAALHDMAFRTIPNVLAACLTVCGLILRSGSGDVVPGAIAASMVFVAAFLCWKRGWLGAGDVKLLAAAALLVAPVQVPQMLAFIAMAGGMLALPYFVARHRLVRPAPRRPALLFERILRAERWRLGRGGPLPYAVAILAGVSATIVHGTP